MAKLEDKLKEALKNIDDAKKIVEMGLQNDNEIRKELYLRDFKIELFDMQRMLRHMLEEVHIVE